MNGLTARQENALTLRNVLGMDEESAEDFLQQNLLISVNNSDETGNVLSYYLKHILTRTVTNISNVLSNNPDIEIIINDASPRSSSQKVYINIDTDKIEISNNPFVLNNGKTRPHKALVLLGASYASAFILRQIIGDNTKLPVIQNDLTIEFGQIFSDLTFLNKEVGLGTIYLAGGGAVGNAFLYALKEFDVAGKLVIADPDSISEGNLNRCVWFNESMLGKNKAETLVDVASSSFPKLKLVAHQDFLSTVSEKKLDERWLRRLVVTVDSRRARRGLQTEIPGEVFDSSTTNIEEVVLHFHKRPLSDRACLECIYPQDKIENAHEQHVADSLGISISDMKELYVSKTAASKIMRIYKSYSEKQLMGLSYDTLFKELCGQGKLQIGDEKQIFAPFAFVSILAGTILAMEMIRRITTGQSDYNYWKLSPWVAPVPRLKQVRLKHQDCTFCNNKTKSDFADRLWSS